MKYVRGSTITLRADPFKDASGEDIVPDTVTAYLDYPAGSGSRAQVTVAMAQDDADIWVGVWASSVAYPGTVFFSIVAESEDGNCVQDGKFQLTGNQSNLVSVEEPEEDEEGGGSSYTASAVHFVSDDVVDDVLTIASLTASNSDKCAFNLWFLISAGIPNTALLRVGDGLVGIFVDASGSLEIDCDEDGQGNNAIYAYGNEAPVTLDAWHNFRGKVNTTTGTVTSFLDNATVSFGSVDVVGNPFTIPFSGAAVVVPRFGIGVAFDAADWWFAPGSGYAFVAGGDDFISATGKPQNPTGFPSGAILYSGNATGFPINQGTGGAAEQTGSLTNASTSPSD